MLRSVMLLDDIHTLAQLIWRFLPEEIPQARRWVQERLDKFAEQDPAWYAQVLKLGYDEVSAEEIAVAAAEQEKTVAGLVAVLDIFNHIPSLQHLCRLQIVRNIKWRDIDSLEINPVLSRYLKYRDFATVDFLLLRTLIYR